MSAVNMSVLPGAPSLKKARHLTIGGGQAFLCVYVGRWTAGQGTRPSGQGHSVVHVGQATDVVCLGAQASRPLQKQERRLRFQAQAKPKPTTEWPRLLEPSGWCSGDHPWEARVRCARVTATSPTYGPVTVVIIDEPGQGRCYWLCLSTALTAPQLLRRLRRRQ